MKQVSAFHRGDDDTMRSIDMPMQRPTLSSQIKLFQLGWGVMSELRPKNWTQKQRFLVNSRASGLLASRASSPLRFRPSPRGSCLAGKVRQQYRQLWYDPARQTLAAQYE